MTTDQEKKRWEFELIRISKEHQRNTITDAKDIGELTYTEIAELVDLSVPRVKTIVREVRKERQEAATK